MPPADEALKSLVSRFKESPASAFTELAANLLARGHAAEALRIAEHGLQMMPASVDGRIERAAALLALGRPRVAYIELKRALAINPTNRKAMRLLGKVYVDAGAPSRAAELLAQRFKGGDEDEQEPTHVTHSPFPMNEGATEAVQASPPPIPSPGRLHLDLETPAPTTRSDTDPQKRREHPTEIRGDRREIQERTHPTAQMPKDKAQSERMATDRAHSKGVAASVRAPAKEVDRRDVERKESDREAAERAIPDLFADLTRDLGLGESNVERPVTRVEVTQVIRRRGAARPRSPSELGQIDGPIVDTTQPGKLQEASTDIVPPPLGPGAPPLFDAVTSPRLHLAPFGLDDEPLFQEHMPFAVRPVESSSEPDPMSDLRETIDEEMPPELDAALRRAMDSKSSPAQFPGSSTGQFSDPGDTLVDQVEESRVAVEKPSSLQVPPRLTERTREKKAEPADVVRFEGAVALQEVSRQGRRTGVAAKLEVVVPKAKPAHIALAVIGLIAMAAYLALLFLSTPASWVSSFMHGAQPPAGHGATAERGFKR
jgi:hypothetical protein